MGCLGVSVFAFHADVPRLLMLFAGGDCVDGQTDKQTASGARRGREVQLVMLVMRR